MSLLDSLLVVADERAPAVGIYDERRSLTLDADGRALISVAETREITEVSGERDDPWPEQPQQPENPNEDDDIDTRTFVERETDELSDLARSANGGWTETAVGGEKPDRDFWS